MNDKKNIIEFKDLFEKEIKDRKVNHKPDRFRNYGHAIIMYLLIMLVFASILVIGFLQFETFRKQNVEQLLDQIKYDIGGITVIDLESFENARPSYKKDVQILYELDNQYLVVVNKNNSYAGILLLSVDNDNEIVFNQVVFDAMVKSPRQITKWTEDIFINVYYGETINIPYEFHPNSIEVEFRVELIQIVMSLINFLIYLLLTPIVIYLLKVDIIDDFKEFKVDKVQAINQVIIAYFFLIVGNVLSNYLSTFLGGLLGIEPSTSVNQEVIESALKSNGIVLMILSAVILGPIAEELIFRKAIFGLIKKNSVALIVSSLVFGLIHLLNEETFSNLLVNGVSYFIMGLIFGYIYIRNKRNIMVPIIVHIVSNLISVLFILFY
jgi:membrane protease YdiL (CAAX protease family)